MLNTISKVVVAGLAAITASAVVLPTTSAAQCVPNAGQGCARSSHFGVPGGWSPGGRYVGPIGPTGRPNFATIGPGGGWNGGLQVYNPGTVGQYSQPRIRSYNNPGLGAKGAWDLYSIGRLAAGNMPHPWIVVPTIALCDALPIYSPEQMQCFRSIGLAPEPIYHSARAGHHLRRHLR